MNLVLHSAPMSHSHQFDEKFNLLMRWVYRWGYTDRYIAWKLFGRAGQPKTEVFAVFIDNGWVREYQDPGSRRKLIFLTAKGAKEARLLGFYNRPYRMDVSRVNFSQLNHYFCSQWIALDYSKNPDIVLPEKYLRRERNDQFYRIPDALIEDSKIAIEVELHQKSKRRFYEMFFNIYYTMQRKQSIEEVHWHFFDRKTYNVYRSYFDEELWPSYVLRKRPVKRVVKDRVINVQVEKLFRQKQVGSQEDTVMLGENFRNRIRFSLHEEKMRWLQQTRKPGN